jgi:membrane protein implicated in regulation of membrane protease activity
MSSQWPLTVSILVFVGTAIVIAVAGTRLVRIVDERSRRSHKRSARDNVAIGAALVNTVLSALGVIVARSAACERRVDARDR